MEQVIAKLKTVFRRIECERMHDMPVCNSALRVEAVGFRQWQDYYLGVLVTPWFMNLMLLPSKANSFANLCEGSKQTYLFPSGRYEFICGREPELGSYQVCSLFSPMDEFPDQQTAVDTATQVLSAMMDVQHQDTSTLQAESRITTAQLLEQARKPAASMSRRDFLRGGRARPGEHDHGN